MRRGVDVLSTTGKGSEDFDKVVGNEVEKKGNVVLDVV